MTPAEIAAMMAFANFCDVSRLYELEFAGKMPKGSANKFVRGGTAYLIRIVQLRDKFRNEKYPGPRVIT